MNSQIPVKEIQIPIECGYLAAKEWGLSTGQPFLALHGWQDNASSFDRLIPLLAPGLHIIAFDYIGHGKSSHKISGMPYYKLDFIYHIKLVTEHLNWKKFSIIGHSMGCELAIVFSSLYSEMVDRVIGIDFIKPVTYSGENIVVGIKWNIEAYRAMQEKILDKSNLPIYTKNQAIKRLVSNGFNDCGETEVEPLIERGMKQLEPGKFIFRHDPCIKSIWDGGFNSYAAMKEIVLNIRCDLLLIKGKQSSMTYDKDNSDEFLKIFSEKCNKFEYVEIDGNHFIHLSYPERIAPVINKFIENNRSTWNKTMSHL